MLYRFKSKASGDVIMVKAHGDQVLAALGKEASPKGIVTVEQLPGAIAALQAAIERDDAARRATADLAEDDGGTDPARAVGLKRRAWPMLDMLQRARAEGVDIVWGV
jgi:hypothetical protein